MPFSDTGPNFKPLITESALNSRNNAHSGDKNERVLKKAFCKYICNLYFVIAILVLLNLLLGASTYDLKMKLSAA